MATSLPEQDLSFEFNLDDWGNYTFDPEDFDNADYALANAEQIVKTTFPPIVMIVALFGNIFCIKTFAKLSTGSFPSSGFLLTLALFDLFLLTIQCGNGWYESIRGLNVIKTMKKNSDLNCKVFSFLTNVVVAFYNWLMVVVVAEMYYIQRNPHAVTKLITSYVKDTLAVLTVVFICMNVHYFWTMGIVSIAEDLKGFGKLVDKFCMFTMASISGRPNTPDHQLAYWWHMLDITASAFIPFAIIAILLSLYAFKPNCHMMSSQDQESDVTSTTSLKTADELRQMFHINVPLIQRFTQKVYPVLALAFLLCNLPHFSVRAVDFLMSEPLNSPVWTLFSSISQQLQYSFYAIKVVIYMLRSDEVRNVTGKTLRNSWLCTKRTFGCRKNHSSRHSSIVYQEVALL